MHIDWASLARVAVVAAAAAVSIGLLVSFAVVALSRSGRRPDWRPAGGPEGGDVSVATPVIGLKVVFVTVFVASRIGPPRAMS